MPALRLNKPISKFEKSKKLEGFRIGNILSFNKNASAFQLPFLILLSVDILHMGFSSGGKSFE